MLTVSGYIVRRPRQTLAFSTGMLTFGLRSTWFAHFDKHSIPVLARF